MITEVSRIDEVLDLTNQAVLDVFQTMLAMGVTPHDPIPLPSDPEGQVISSVGFIGEITGAAYLHARVSFARLITGRMLGLAVEEVESEMVNDALGELSNMVVGNVKSLLCNRGLACTLTIPSIVRGHQLSIEKPAHVSTRVVGFKYGEHHLLAEIFIKEV
jgi:chemotaxis protein CheX